MLLVWFPMDLLTSTCVCHENIAEDKNPNPIGAYQRRIRSYQYSTFDSKGSEHYQYESPNHEWRNGKSHLWIYVSSYKY